MCITYFGKYFLNLTLRCEALNRTCIAVIMPLLRRHIVRIKEHDALRLIVPHDMQHRAIIAAAYGIGIAQW